MASCSIDMKEKMYKIAVLQIKLLEFGNSFSNQTRVLSDNYYAQIPRVCLEKLL